MYYCRDVCLSPEKKTKLQKPKNLVYNVDKIIILQMQLFNPYMSVKSQKKDVVRTKCLMYFILI